MTKKRQSSGSSTTTSATISTVTGVTIVDSAELMCGCPEPGPETIQVEQVIGAEMAQRVVEFDMIVPEGKPEIEQIIDVYVKNVEINTVDVIPNKVIVRGDLEVKVMYIADLPDQPVRALERRHVRFTRDIEILGAEPGMNATADVTVEFIDYDFDCDEDHHHHEHHKRKAHIVIVLKVWARVVSTTEMDVYALSPIDQLGVTESTTATATAGTNTESVSYGTTSASETGGGEIAGYGAQNVFVSGPLTPTAGMAIGVSGQVTVTGSVVNIRTGPGTNFPVVTKVNKGTTLTIKESAFGWYKVVLSDGSTTGWIASWLVSGAPKG